MNSPSSPQTEEKPRVLEVCEDIGLGSLPKRFVQRLVRKGTVFNILVIGKTGIGKSTFINSLLDGRLLEQYGGVHNQQTTLLNVQNFELEHESVKLRLSIAETRGYGDQVNCGKCYERIIEFIDCQFEKYLQQELSVDIRSDLSLHDTRVHCCLYLVSPMGHGLRAVDLLTLKHLNDKVNVVLVIAQADTITPEELVKLKAKILNETRDNGVKTFDFTTDDFEVANMNDLLPFAVVGSNDFVSVDGRLVRARKYPWGVVEVENSDHCDTVHLRDAILRVNFEDLKETTHSKIYELYRRFRLQQMGFFDAYDFQIVLESQRKAQEAELKKKREEIQLKRKAYEEETYKELSDKQRNLRENEQVLIRTNLEQLKLLEEEKNALQMEILEFNSQKESFERQFEQVEPSTFSNLNSTAKAPRWPSVDRFLRIFFFLLAFSGLLKFFCRSSVPTYYGLPIDCFLASLLLEMCTWCLYPLALDSEPEFCI